jgi:tRNA nucleotidyltransferase (CCA-adding enzyme)
MMMYNEVKKIINPVYLVGGAVRDILNGVEPHDYDFCTPLKPDQIEEAFKNSGRRVWKKGKRVGTISSKVYLPELDRFEEVDVTTFRTEEYDGSSRIPKVEFVDHIEQDLGRRDFTVNAMAWRDGRIIDPYGGREDLREGVLRSVGHPKQRYKEDPLRMLRAFRFASQHGYYIEERTLKGINEKPHRILRVSRERWVMEMDKLLHGLFVSNALREFGNSELIKFMFPELAIQVGYDQNTPHHDFTLWEHTYKVVQAARDAGSDTDTLWACLLHDIGKPFAKIHKPGKDRFNYPKHDMIGAEIVKKYSKYLRWSNERSETVLTLVRDHLSKDSPLQPFDSGWAQKLIHEEEDFDE